MKPNLIPMKSLIPISLGMLAGAAAVKGAEPLSCPEGQSARRRFLRLGRGIKLAVVQLRVETVLREEFVVGALLYDTALVHYEYHVSIPYR